MSNTVSDEIKKYNTLDSQPTVIFGTSGISKEVYSVINEINEHYGRTVFDFIGYIAENDESIGLELTGGKAICTDDSFREFTKNYKSIAAVIPLGTPSVKCNIKEKFNDLANIYFPNIISPTAKFMIKDKVYIGEGNIICSGVVATTDIQIGSFNLVNLNATIGHDVLIGDYNVINPLSAISGFVTIKDKVLIGAGVSIKEHLVIESDSIVGMGAIVCKNVETGTIVVSDRAKPLERKQK